ncbi:MAG: tRNA pseudouridine(55) synthase TruB [Actinomycetota bacterium]
MSRRTRVQAPSGLLVIDKAPGPSSHDAVEVLRRLYSTPRVGHAGTLDPPATGVLLVGLERATRILSFLQGLAKTYRAGIQFGETTTTGDATGEVTERGARRIELAELTAAAGSFVGEITQIPPMVSAVKVGGERLYRIARRGEQVPRPARRITIHKLEVESFDEESSRATVRMVCSSGTYVRTLAEDLGERLGCGGHVRTLRRLGVGSFSVDEAKTLEALEAMSRAQRHALVLPMSVAMRDFPSVVLSAEELEAVSHGRPLPAGLETLEGSGGPVAILDPSGQLVAVYRHRGERLEPAAVLTQSPAPRP